MTIIKPITATEWGTKDFYVEGPDGYIIGSAAARPQANNRLHVVRVRNKFRRLSFWAIASGLLFCAECDRLRD